jgi:uroporphyrinogen decarboxylase
MTGKERIIKTLKFEEPDYPPHFEVMFELEKEAFGDSFPAFEDWPKFSKTEKARQIEHCADIYEKIVDRYKWDGFLVYYPWCDAEGITAVKKRFNDEIFLGGVIGNSIWSIEALSYGTYDDIKWEDFSMMLIEEPERLHAVAARKADEAIERAKPLIAAGVDFIHIVNDVAFNGGPFISPAQFREFITPYLKKQVEFIKSQGVYAFVHTDGNIDPIMEDYLSLGAHCFQSVDPMAGMDIAAMKRQCQGKMALMGNVQCNYLQDGPKELIAQSSLYALENCYSGGGYIFGTSNTIFKGMPLEHYEYMVEVYHDFCKRLVAKKAAQ